MVDRLFEELSHIEQVEAIALGGSRAGENYDEKSDYDVYVYCTAPIPDELRRSVLEKYCTAMEIGNHYWEYEDNCTLNNGIDIDIIYRSLDNFSEEISAVVEHFQARNGYTTCMWHNLNKCKAIYDKNGRLLHMKKRFDVPYPDQLKDNIIARNTKLLYNSMPAYTHQIRKAVSRNDKVSVIHRTTAFLESYFDIIFALNKRTHPGEKRLTELCRQTCSILPCNFEANLDKLFNDMPTDPENTVRDIDMIVEELKKVI